MTSDVPLDYAVFQLSPRWSRCELFVCYDGTTEKLTSGLVKPFVTHLKVAEEQVALAVRSIKLEVERYKNAETWFTKGTLERFVQFVSTPEVLEMVSTFDVEMSQLEAARKIYSQGEGDHQSSASGEDGAGATGASDATKKELLRAIDVRLAAVTQDLTTAWIHASAAGFDPESVSELQHFAHRFGAHRLSEACSKFIELSKRRHNLTWKSSSDQFLRSSTASDMSFDSPSSDQPMPEERETGKYKDKDKILGPTTTSSTTTTATESDTSTQSSQTPKLTRRLSVQERISLFENKQKENSPSTPTPPSSSVSAGVKPDLRRQSLSSDVASSSDKAVLRRWSGASDMSIDVSGDRREFDTNVNTPTPTSSSSSFHVFPAKSKDQVDKIKDFQDSKLPVRAKFGAQLAVSSGSGLEEPALSDANSKVESFSGRSSENMGLKEKSPIDYRIDLGFENQKISDPTQFKSQPGETEQFGYADQTSQEKVKGPSGGESRSQQDTGKDSGPSDGHQGEAEDNLVRNHSVPRSQFRNHSDVHPQTVDQKKSLVGEVEKVGRKDFESFEKQAESSGSLRSNKFQGHCPVPEQVKKPRGGKEEGDFGFRRSQLALTEKNTLETQEAFSSTYIESMDQVQRVVRQSKGSQGLHDELKMKANELEKLFAEHKLRVPADQSNSSRRTRPTEAQLKMEVETAVGSSNIKFNSIPLMKNVNNQDCDVTPKHNIYSLSFSDDSRGSLYQKYMQKRDAKLREDWSSRKDEKEAKMKALQDNLEKSRAEMMAKLVGSADKRNSVHDARQRAEKLRSSMKREQPLDLYTGDEDEDQAESLGKKLSETFLGINSSRSSQSKKGLPNKNTASSTPRNSTAPIARSSGKASNFAAGRRRLNSDNPLAQSVPNFSDLRKENTKPSSAVSKAVRSQGRNHARKKSSSDVPFVSDEMPRRSHSLKKSIPNPIESNDSHNYDDVDNNVPKKGNGVGHTFGSGIGRSKASVMIEAVRNGHNFDDVGFETEEMTDVAKVEDDDFETTIGGESADMDNGKARLSQESDKSTNSGYENRNSFRFSQAGPASAIESPTSVPLLFGAMGSIHDSPGESPGSWNARVQNAFSFSHDISDVDASDSPLGSPASWNFHTLAQTEAEAARMRKKWGAAQKPIVVTDSSHTRKDVTKGLKRFLKFGRKNRASESLADWISATTSEGDDDMEDGRDPVYRSSEDLRKSRMGFSHSHHLDDGFNESDLFNEQVHTLQSSIQTPPANFKLREEHISGSSVKGPKSFFSLSNFRSRGSDSKPR